MTTCSTFPYSNCNALSALAGRFLQHMVLQLFLLIILKEGSIYIFNYGTKTIRLQIILMYHVVGVPYSTLSCSKCWRDIIHLEGDVKVKNWVEVLR